MSGFSNTGGSSRGPASSFAPLVVIPARMGSTRFPGKPLVDISGRSLILRVCDLASRIPGTSGLLVATDHEEILRHVHDAGYDAVMTDGGHHSGSDRVAEAVADWAGPVLNLQGDEPLADIDLLGRLVARMGTDDRMDIGTVAVPLTRGELCNPDRVKVWRGEDGFARDFSRRAPGSAPVDQLLRHAGVYLYRREALGRFVAAAPAPREVDEKLEQLRALALGMSIWVEVGQAWGPGVDRPGDLKVVAKELPAE